MRCSLTHSLVGLALLLLLAPVAAAEGLSVDAPWGHGMVVQRDEPVTVRGAAGPGDKVVVAFAGKKRKATADEHGRWTVVFDAVKAGPPRRLTVESGAGDRVEIGDILAGDVWLCSGQSNMAWTVRQSNDAAKEIAAADHPAIRLLTVPRRPMVRPADLAARPWATCSSKTVANFSAVGYFFGRELARKLRIPIGLINSSYGGTPAEAWTRAEALPDEVLRARHRKMVESKEPGPRLPSCLWNGMVSNLVGFPVRGVIWYQGESNASRAELYRTLFPAMIRDWRAQWGREDLPFYFVQLANFGKNAPNAPGCPWAELREAQLHTLRTVPHTGMAVTIDIGNPKDIHPRNKQDVGMRLAQWALAGVYGKKVAVSGPLPASHEVDGDRIVVSFEHADGGLKLRPGPGGISGFTIAGEDKVFHPAQAKVDGSKVVVSAPGIEKPLAVRYAWANSPVATLFNGKGLPASPFRTDDWPRITAGKR